MRFFISGQINDAANVRNLIDKVKIAGHEITHDWTVTDVFLGSLEAKLKDKQETGLRAAKDIQGVVDSDVYVLSSDNEQVGKGMYVELGAALALNTTTGKPKIYVVGEMNHMSVFYLHPAVIHMAKIEEVIEAVAKDESQGL
jgi:hypothetical protein